MSTPSRRRRPRTRIGKLIRAWPRIRLAIRVARLVMRARLAIQTALVTTTAVWLYRAYRRRRRRPRPRGSEPLRGYAPPPAGAVAPAGTEHRVRAEM
jgi:hypothetical protein